MKIRGQDKKLRYQVDGTEVRDVRACECEETLPGTRCVVCGRPKPAEDDSPLRSK